MLQRLINYFDDPDHDGRSIGIVIALVVSLAMTFTGIMGLHDIHHMNLLYLYPIISIIIFLFTSRCKIDADSRNVVIFGSLFWLPAFIAVVLFFIARTACLVPGQLVNAHEWLSKAKVPSIRLPSFRKNIELGHVPVQGPFRTSQKCGACDRPL